jgi:hypothetical protein
LAEDDFAVEGETAPGRRNCREADGRGFNRCGQHDGKVGSVVRTAPDGDQIHDIIVRQSPPMYLGDAC